MKTIINNTVTRVISLALVLALVMSFGVTAHATEIDDINDIVEEVGVEIDDIVEEELTPRDFVEVPLMSQIDYPHVKFGKHGSISSHGCGMVSLAMVATYLLDEYVDPVDLVKKWGHYNTEDGVLRIIYKLVAEDLGLNLEETGNPHSEYYTWEEAKAALEAGKVIICGQDAGIFTSGRHLIVLTNLTEDGRVMVNDPNSWNWTKYSYEFEYGFTEEQIYLNANAYWVFEKVVEEEAEESIWESDLDIPDADGVYG